MGIKQHSAAEENLNLWFRAQKPQPPHLGMSELCLYYQPCEDDDNGWFIIIISTPEQQATAWPYGHNNLLLLDGTFAAHADYNSNLLEDLLLKWKHGMGKNPADGGDFDIRVVLTDNDTREHKAWHNALNRKLRVIPCGDDCQKTRCSLVEFLLELLKNVYHFEDAIELYNKQLFHFQELAKKSDPISQKKSQGSLAFLSYFHTYIKMKDFWRCESK
ncbi:hypothetical protein SCLCIDRAFT_27660 [Scleroderma citrinum Foug A]|uniref:Uncharacterized protein n=1 Tax=Scleroderma citrinum Foug A TaxID=1036808 RepID=A0A0C3A2P6_9AGAM|nr:hypothetical protein SCLCIDRAFT_27660 [Scleroderma citrinum Foug A]